GRGDALHAGGDRNWRQTHAPHHALRFAEEPGRTRVAATARQGIARRGRGGGSRTGLDSIVSQFATEFPDWCCAPAQMGLVYERIVNYRGGVRIERPIFRVIPSRKMPLGPVRDRSATGKRRMEGSNDLGRLDTKHWSQLQDLASRF